MDTGRIFCSSQELSDGTWYTGLSQGVSKCQVRKRDEWSSCGSMTRFKPPRKYLEIRRGEITQFVGPLNLI
jgi:hypothetical protein